MEKLEKILSAQADIEKRLAAHRLSKWDSHFFLLRLYNIVVLRSNFPKSMNVELQELLSRFQFRLSTIRWELARIPIELCAEKYKSRNYPHKGYKEIINFRLEDKDKQYFEQYTLTLEEAACLDYMPSLETLLETNRNHHKFWCLAEKPLPIPLPLPDTPYWDEEDSLVEWITQYVETTLADPDQAIKLRPVQSDLTPTERIYNYIQMKSPVATADILARQFASRSRTFAILKDLEREDKIKKEKHGVYMTI